MVQNLQCRQRLKLHLLIFLFSLIDKAKGEEGPYFQGDIKLMPDDDPYNLYNRVFKRVAPVPFDGEGSGVSEDFINSNAISTRLWPKGHIPFKYSSTLRKLFLQLMTELHFFNFSAFLTIS